MDDWTVESQTRAVFSWRYDTTEPSSSISINAGRTGSGTRPAGSTGRHRPTPQTASVWATPVSGTADRWRACRARPAADRDRGTGGSRGEGRFRAGALAVRGPSTFDGYRRAGGGFDRRNRDDWFVTGDAGHVDAAGEVFVAGRLDEVVVVRGRNIYAEDLEHAVIAGGVLVVGVAALRSLSHDDQFDVVLAAPAAARPQSAAELARQVRSLRREASAAPINAVHVVPPRCLLRTTSGKVRQADCRRLIMQGEYVSVSGG